MKKRLLILPVIAGLALSGCSFEDLMFWKKKEEQQQETPQETPSVVSVTLTAPSKKVYTTTAAFDLAVTVNVTGGASKALSWSSSDTSVATVLGGKVTPVGVGTVTITATSNFDSTKSDSVTFSVNDPGFAEELLEKGYDFSATWPTAELKKFVGIDTFVLTDSKGFYYKENAESLLSSASFEILGSYSETLADAASTALYNGDYYYFEDSYETSCFIDPTQKVEVDVYGTYIDEAQTKAGLILEFYRTEDKWESSTPTTDTAWETETAAALADLGVELPFVALGEEYSVYVYSDGSVEISDDCCDFTKLDGYGAVLTSNQFEKNDDDEYVKSLNAYSYAVVRFGFTEYGNTIQVERVLKKLDNFPGTEVATFVGTDGIGSKYSVPAFSGTAETKYTYDSYKIELSEDDVRDAVEVGVYDVNEEQCNGYIQTLVTAGFELDTENSYSKTNGVSIAFLQKGKICIAAEIIFGEREATEQEIEALLDVDTTQMTEEEYYQYFSYYLEYYMTGKIMLPDYDTVENALIFIYGDEEGIEDPGLYIKEKSIKLNPEGTFTIKPIFHEIDEATVTYESSDTSVATVDASGVVTAVALGKATITASIAETTYSATLEVNVVEKNSMAQHVALANEWLAEKEVTETITLPEVADATDYTSEYDSQYNCWSISVYADDPDEALENYIDLLESQDFEVEDATEDQEGYYVYLEGGVYLQIICLEDDFFYVDVHVKMGGDNVIVFAEEDYEDKEVVTSAELGNGTQLAFNKGSASTSPTYYDNGSALRVYAKSTIVVTAPTGKLLSSIEFDMSADKTDNVLTASVGTYSNGVWTAPTGGVSTVTFTVGGSSGHVKIASIGVALVAE